MTDRQCRNRLGKIVNRKCYYCPLTAPFKRPEYFGVGSCIKRLSKTSVN
jgi:hypothetical protein